MLFGVRVRVRVRVRVACTGERNVVWSWGERRVMVPREKCDGANKREV